MNPQHTFYRSYLLLFFLMFSCVTEKIVIENDPKDPSTALEEIQEKVVAGDVVQLNVHNKIYKNLRVMSIDGQKMKVKQYLPNGGHLIHEVNLIYIKELQIIDTEATYPLGAPMTIAIIILYLLV